MATTTDRLILDQPNAAGDIRQARQMLRWLKLACACYMAAGVWLALELLGA